MEGCPMHDLPLPSLNSEESLTGWFQELIDESNFSLESTGFQDFLQDDPLQFEIDEKPFGEFDDIQEVQNQDNMINLINEMDSFINHQESFSSTSMEKQNLSSQSSDSSFSNLSPPQTPFNDIHKDLCSIVNPANITNVSEFVLADGRNIIIMIATPNSDNGSSVGQFTSSNPCSPTPSTSSSASFQHSSSMSVKSPRERRLSTPMKSKIVDKKERKKWQNVEAARRYRDKKKIKQGEFEMEVKMLEDKNLILKERIREMENEVLTLKKLMKDLGVVKS